MNRSIFVARGALILLAAAGVIVTILGSLPVDTWWIRYLAFPRLEFLIAMLIAFALLALVPQTWASRLALVGLAGAAAYDAFLLFPFTTAAPVEELAAGVCPAGRRLRLLEVNVQMTNRHDHRLVMMVRKVKPDIAWFQETDAWWARELGTLGDILPNHVAAPKPNYFGVDLYSRLPLEGARLLHLTGSADPGVVTTVVLPSGDRVRLYAIHPRPPQAGQGTAERDAQLLATALMARSDPLPHIVAGDLNSVPWEGAIKRTERIGRLLDPRRGRGLHISWNAHHWIMKWPLDQILPGPAFTLIDLKVLPAFGSDHHPYLATLCLDPAAAARQAPAPARPAAIAAALREIAKGQGEARKVGYKGRYGPDGTRSGS